MNRLFLVLVQALVLALASAVSPGAASLASTHSVSVTTDDSRAIERCDQVGVRFDGRGSALDTVRAEERFAATRSEVAKLRVTFAGAGGIDARGWDGDGYQITVCKTAGARGAGRAQEIMDRIAVSFRDGSLSAKGPDDEAWLAYAIVRVPKNGNLEFFTENGGIALREVTGKALVRSRNGPISLTKCSGDMQADAENGPIHSEACAGQQKLAARNGPLDIDLAGSKWTGDGLTARTDNGPLNLQLGDDAPAVRLETARHTLLSCHAKACAHAHVIRRRDSRRIDLGAGPPLVRVSATNGPVNIADGAGGSSEATKDLDDDDAEETGDQAEEDDGII